MGTSGRARPTRCLLPLVLTRLRRRRRWEGGERSTAARGESEFFSHPSALTTDRHHPTPINGTLHLPPTTLSYRLETPKKNNSPGKPRSERQNSRSTDTALFISYPAYTVIEEALRAARRVNDFSTAVRVFEGLSAFFLLLSLSLSLARTPCSLRGRGSLSLRARGCTKTERVCGTKRTRAKSDTSDLVPPTEEKTENAQQYKQYVDELAPLRKELGIALREELYGSSK